MNIAALIQSAIALGFGKKELIDLADFAIARFTPGYTDAQKENFRANLTDSIERGVRLRLEIVQYDEAKARATQTDPSRVHD
jgi:hypothetical protein